MAIVQTWANYGPRAKSGPPILLFWPAGTYNLNSHHELSGRLFLLEITDGSDFQKNMPQMFKIEMKNEIKTFYFGDHIRTWTVISKKRKGVHYGCPFQYIESYGTGCYFEPVLFLGFGLIVKKDSA